MSSAGVPLVGAVVAIQGIFSTTFAAFNSVAIIAINASAFLVIFFHLHNKMHVQKLTQDRVGEVAATS